MESNSSRRRDDDEDDDEDFNYDSEYKSKCTGLGALLGSIRSNDSAAAESSSSRIDPATSNYGSFNTRPDGFSASSRSDNYSRNGYEEYNEYDNSDRNYIQRVCDTGPGTPRVSKAMRLGQSYFCDLCNLSLTSEIAYKDHVSGIKHMKKARNVERTKALLDAGLATDIPAKRMKAAAIPIAKTPYVSLQELVKSANDSVVGLSYITGYLPATDPEDYEVSYQCSLCMVTALTSVMFTHVMGVRHRGRFAEMVLGHSGLDRIDLLDVCRQHEWQHGRDVDCVTTVFDDSKYPFPPGKGPRKESEGGVGGESSRASSRLEQPKERESDEDTSRNHSFLMKLSLCSIRSDDDAAMAHQVITNLTRSLVKFKVSRVDPRYSTDMTACSESLLRSLNTLMSVPTPEATSDSTQSSMRHNVPPPAPRTGPGPAPPASGADLRMRWQPVPPGYNQASQQPPRAMANAQEQSQPQQQSFMPPIPPLPKPLSVHGESPLSTPAAKRPLLPTPSPSQQQQRLLPQPPSAAPQPDEGGSRLPLDVRLRNLVGDVPPPQPRPAPPAPFNVRQPPPRGFAPRHSQPGGPLGPPRHSQPGGLLGPPPRPGFANTRPGFAPASAELPSLMAAPRLQSLMAMRMLPRPTRPGQF